MENTHICQHFANLELLKDIVLTLSMKTDRPEQIVQAQIIKVKQNVASDQWLHCSPLVQQFLDTSTGSKLGLFKFQD